MSQPFRVRSGELLPPGQRPHKRRQAARVLLVADHRVLLFADTDPGVPGSQWWVTPGGGIDPGESPAQAAVREVFEETGLRIRADDLLGPIAHRVVTHGYSDQVLVQQEWFYRVDLDAEFDVNTQGFTELEKLTMTDHGWFTANEIAEMTVWPERVADLVTADPNVCLEWGYVDESTVPLRSRPDSPSR